MFDEGGFEIYEHRKLVRIEFPEKNEIDKAAENRRLTVNELMKRTCNEYWSIEESGDEKKKAEFIQKYIYGGTISLENINTCHFDLLIETGLENWLNKVYNNLRKYYCKHPNIIFDSDEFLTLSEKNMTIYKWMKEYNMNYVIK
ncbi:hypothetical protein C2G38_2254352 [Gigaspora rosea]|uniref:BTB domain-containing protein n=1 Tax=Gigaspora rosea TaxID=44941 RepID=A0A397U2S0_9GLOM|nr:hypothetical protein C2G38_2254352 [Gigaspora rosea]